MSDPPVDPRTEADPSRGASAGRRRPSVRPEHPGDGALGQPTVQVPLGRGSEGSPPWNIGDLQEPPPFSTAPTPEYATQYVPTTDYAPEDEYLLEAGYDAAPPMFGPPPGFMKPRVRKVSRVLRAVDAWSVFKVSIIFYLAMYLVCLIAGVLLWNVAYSTGTIDNVASFFESFGWKSFEFKGGEIFHNAWILGLFLVVGLTGLNVVLATLFNLIADVVGGIRLTVLEEEVMIRRVDGAGGAPAEAAVGATSPLLPDPVRSRRSRRGPRRR